MNADSAFHIGSTHAVCQDYALAGAGTPAGPYAIPFIKEAMEAGYQGDFVGAAYVAPLAATYLNMRKTTIYGGSNEVQRNIVAQTVLG